MALDPVVTTRPCTRADCHSIFLSFDYGAASLSKAFAVCVQGHYGEQEYWNKRYQNQPGRFDWYHKYWALKQLLEKNCPKNGRVLQIGCGLSSLQALSSTNCIHMLHPWLHQPALKQPLGHLQIEVLSDIKPVMRIAVEAHLGSHVEPIR